ncbi:hypothetical protein Tco_0396807 [Tanacetum coccineum]
MIVRYLRQTINMGLLYSKDSGFELIAYSDGDHAGCNDDCKSTSGGIQFLEIRYHLDENASASIWISLQQDSNEHVEKGTFELYFVGTEYQLADLFTKALPKERFEYLFHMIGIRCMTPPPVETTVFHMAQQVIPAAQLVPRFHIIRRCNNYAVLQSIPCSPECNDLWADSTYQHSLCFGTTTVDVPVVYLQQFWRTVSKVPDILHLPVETPENPFAAPVNIEAFMNRVDYQGVVDKSSSFNTSCTNDDIHSHHDDHQDDDAPPEGEIRVNRHTALKSSKFVRGSSSKHSAKDSTTYVSRQQQEWDAWVEETVIDEDEVILEEETPELITELQDDDKRVPTIFGYERMRATLNDALSNQFKNAEEYAYHLEQTTNFMENQIVWESRQEDIRRLVPRPLYGNTKEKKYILSLHKIHAERFPEVDLEEKMNRWVRKEFKTFNEDARLSIQHWKDSWHKRVYKQNQRRVRNNPEDYFSNHRITEVVRITTDQPHGLDFMEQIIVMRENDKPDSFSEADFKYLNKNDIEDLYYLCRNKKVNYRETKLMNSLITFIRSRVIWERVHDFQLGIESYQIKVNLTAPTLTFPGIEAHEPYSIVDKPSTGLIYLNNKDEKRVMYLTEIVKFCDATLEKVLKEVKLKIFQSEPWRKPPLLGELDRDILRAFEREITKRLSHREQMRRWESFVNGRPILPTMKRL